MKTYSLQYGVHEYKTYPGCDWTNKFLNAWNYGDKIVDVAFSCPEGGGLLWCTGKLVAPPIYSINGQTRHSDYITWKVLITPETQED